MKSHSTKNRTLHSLLRAVNCRVNSGPEGARNRACAETKPLIRFGQKFRTVVGIPVVITYANLADDRLRGLRVVGGSNFAIPHSLSVRVCDEPCGYTSVQLRQ